jgi:hypothetical protein
MLHRTRPINENFQQRKKFLTTICACDLAPKHSQAAPQLVLIHNQVEDKGPSVWTV